jgi:predicted O-linked N-acetylglucosamine transferase (SPINDLY family)
MLGEDARSAASIYVNAAAAGERGAWLKAGLVFAQLRQLNPALDCYIKALTESPNDANVLHAIITTLFNLGYNTQGVLFARILLLNEQASSEQRSHAALLLSSKGLHDEAVQALKAIVGDGQFSSNPSLIGAILSSATFTCDWAFINQVRQKALEYYGAGQYALVGEYPLTNVAWCADEAINLKVVQAYGLRTIHAAKPLCLSPPKAHSRLRVGYLSNDFRNHATLHLMIGLFEQHDQEQFEIFAYDYSAPCDSDYRQRFLAAVEHHMDISALNDEDAALKIASDDLDLLIDLKGHTGLARPGILAYRPAVVQASYLGFPGSTGLGYVDFLITDRFVTPDSSVPHYVERLCRLPNSYQCNERAQTIQSSTKTRHDFGLPDDGVVFCSFNQAYKIDSMTMDVWLDILKGVPHSVLWVLVDQSEQAMRNVALRAKEKGVDDQRLIFAKAALPTEHRQRIQFADIAVDTLICNGHTTTSDMLRWGAVPVITARGKHFASRVSESLLNAMDLPELVGKDTQDMVKIACEIGNNAKALLALKEKVRVNRSCAALFDVSRFTRNFEKAIRMIIEDNQHPSPLRVLDVLED